ncbi:hypothetical protein E8E14_000197 [Neopestalotiopsis sp. 37M]|nr:hypothetical protein E8E14_000197 [Neopestalotiopsis sp. 37M]
MNGLEDENSVKMSETEGSGNDQSHAGNNDVSDRRPGDPPPTRPHPCFTRQMESTCSRCGEKGVSVGYFPCQDCEERGRNSCGRAITITDSASDHELCFSCAEAVKPTEEQALPEELIIGGEVVALAWPDGRVQVLKMWWRESNGQESSQSEAPGDQGNQRAS